MTDILHPTQRDAFLKDPDKFYQNERERIYTTQFESHFNCWKPLYGPKPKELHVIAGPAGCGKSTWIKSNLLFWAKKYKILLILSEEMFVAYTEIIHQAKQQIKFDHNDGLDHFNPNDPDNPFVIDPELMANKDDIVNNILPVCEDGNEDIIGTPETFKEKIDQLMFEHAPDIVIYDNFTTGVFYNYELELQQEGVKFFRSLAREKEVAVILVAHTSKTFPVANKFVELGDIEGGNSLIKKAAVIGAVTKIIKKGKLLTVFSILKSRLASAPADKLNFRMIHKLVRGPNGVFINDKPIQYDDFMKLKEDVKSFGKPKRS